MENLVLHFLTLDINKYKTFYEFSTTKLRKFCDFKYIVIIIITIVLYTLTKKLWITIFVHFYNKNNLLITYKKPCIKFWIFFGH